MASPASTKPSPSTRAPGQPPAMRSSGLEPDRTPGPGQAGGRLILRPDQTEPAFTYMVHPLRWEARAGHIVPHVIRLSHEPGSNGNGRDSSGVGAVTNWTRDGWIPVPNDFPCEAFGVDRAGEPCTYRNRWTQRHPVTNEIEREHHTDAWHRPRILGSTVVWDYDADGELDFRKALSVWLAADGPDATLIEEALLPLLSEIRATASRSDGRRNIILNALLANLPPEHMPADVRALIASPPGEAAKPATSP